MDRKHATREFYLKEASLIYATLLCQIRLSSHNHMTPIFSWDVYSERRLAWLGSDSFGVDLRVTVTT